MQKLERTLFKERKDVCEKCNTIGPRPQGWHFSMTTLVGQSLAQLTEFRFLTKSLLYIEELLF